MPSSCRDLLPQWPSLLGVAAALLLCPALAHSGAVQPAPAQTHARTIPVAAQTSPAETPPVAAVTTPDPDAAWEAASFAADPANLKRERPEPRDTEDPLPVDAGSSGVEQMLRKLGTRASLLMIVAHPDDEDGGMLTYVSRGLGARVGMLTLTRGEGGQNVMSGDFDDALGLVRTRELLAADRYLGVDQMFGTEADFGFSKTIEEAFTKWTHERVLYDAVRAVRLYRPLVIASVFIGAVTDGHGHHQVSGEIAQEVFHAAADPKVFADMGLPSWQALKVYARVPFATIDERGMYDYATGKYLPARFKNYVTGVSSTAAPHANVTVPEGNPDPLLGGKSYVQFAREGLALQRTQIGSGMRVPPAGRFDVGYTRYGAAPTLAPAEHERTFFDGIDTSLLGIASLAPGMPRAEAQTLRRQLGEINSAIAEANRRLPAGDSTAVADTLAGALRVLDRMIPHVAALPMLPGSQREDLLHELRVKRVQFNDAAVLALDLAVHAHIHPSSALPAIAQTAGPALLSSWLVQGHPFAAEVSLTSPARSVGETPKCELFERFAAPGAPPHVSPCGPLSIYLMRKDSSLRWAIQGSIPAVAVPTSPPFARSDAEQPSYDVSDPRLRNAPEAPAPLIARLTIRFGGVELQREQVVGELSGGAYQPAMVVPSVSVLLSPAAGVVPLDRPGFTLTAHVRALGSPQSGSLHLELPAGLQSSSADPTWSVGSPGATAAVPVTLSFVSPAPGKSYLLHAIAQSHGRDFSNGFETVGYPGITRDNLFRPATYRTGAVEVAIPAGLRVAFLPGTGDAVAASLDDVGIHPTTISVADIAAGRLAAFDALLLGVRAYAAQKELPSVTAKLLEFAGSGGVVVAQYNSAEYDHNFGPYPYSLTGSAEKVVEERAPVRLLDPNAQALRWPNRITPHDFDGWVEERGHGFMTSWDASYAAPTEVHDEGQDPQRGGLLIAPVGQGAYVYCAFALYRQLPAGNPGAFRLLVNLLSLGKRPG